MPTHVALLRGINVGGRNRVAKADLREVVLGLGHTEVATYIQSGNVVFRSAVSDVERLAKGFTAALSKSHGFEPQVLVLSRAEFENAADGNPFPEASENPKSVHLFFLAEQPRKPDLKALEALKTRTERFELKGRIFYLHTPEGFGASKLAARAEKLLGVPATARNWRTVMTLLEMAKAGR